MPTTGEVIAEKYVVDKLIGTGGMGVVYRATQSPLERQVAIKLVRPELEDSAGIRERFRHEAIAAMSDDPGHNDEAQKREQDAASPCDLALVHGLVPAAT